MLSEVAPSNLFFGLVSGIVLFPVIGLLINIIFGKYLGEKGVGTVASLATGSAFVVALLQAYSLSVYPEGAVVPMLAWIHIGSLAIDWAFRVDTLSATSSSSPSSDASAMSSFRSADSCVRLS